MQTRAVEEDAEIIGNDEDALAVQQCYSSEDAPDHGDTTPEIAYDTTLGLAVELPQAGATLEQLWQVLAQN